MANLVTNALRYGAPPVVVTVTSGEDVSTIEVVDHGAGVPAEYVPHLYERFTRPDVSAGRPSGSGFGLYIVGRLAQANGCRITYAAGETTGSRFRLDIPTT